MGSSVPAMVLVGLTLTLARCAAPPPLSVKDNLLDDARSIDRDGVSHAERLTDGQAAVEGDFWLTSLTARIGSARAGITYDLGEERSVGCAFLQGDGNDTYWLLVSKDGRDFTPLWAAGPTQESGMRTRQSRITGNARYVRLMAQGGDGSYSVAELGLFSSCPSDWPELSLPRTSAAPLDAIAQVGLLWTAIAGVGWLLLHRRGMPTWARWLPIVPVALLIRTLFALAEIYPFPNTDTESLIRGIVALVAGVLVLKETFASSRAAPDPRVAGCVLGVLAVAGIGCYYHFGAAQFVDESKGRPSFVHTWDMRNYFPTAKYFEELRFDGVYLASLAAYVDLVGDGDPESIREAHLRDLSDYHMMTGIEAALQLPGIRARFTPERWAEFKQDAKYFIDTMGARNFLGSMQDHGGNATPVWLLSAWLVYRNLPASEWTLGAGGLIDPLLLLIFFFVLARTFGLRVMLYTVVLFGATDFYQFGSNFMGSTLRQDWLVALGLGACALKAGRPFLGGALLAYGGLIRAFPALAALFLLVPVVLFIVKSVLRDHRLPGLRELKTCRGPALRAIGGAAAAVLGLVLLTSGVFGWKQGWTTWIAKIELHATAPSTNNVGLRNLLAYRPSDTFRALGSRSAPDQWDQLQLENFNQLRALFYAINVFVFGALILGVRHRPLHQTTLLGLLLVPFLFYPSNYYCHFVFLLPMAVAAGGRDGARERPFGLVTAVVAALCVGQYFTTRNGWTDERYTQQSLLLIAAFLVILLCLSERGLKAPRETQA